MQQRTDIFFTTMISANGRVLTYQISRVKKIGARVLGLFINGCHVRPFHSRLAKSPEERKLKMIDESYNAIKSDFITTLRIIYREGLSDAFAHLSVRSKDGNEMMFMPRKRHALVQIEDLFFVDFDRAVPQSALHQAIYKVRPDVKAVFHFHSPAVILLSVLGQTIRPMHNYSAIFYDGVPLYLGT